MSSLFTPSRPTSSDYVEMGFLSAFIAVGIPITTYAFYRSLRQYVSSQSRSSPGRFVMLKLHLSAADMLIVYVYALSELIWLGTYRWMGGNVLCKAIKFFHLMSFYLTSNVVVCIALDRAYATFKIYQLRHKIKTYNITKRMLQIAWIVAIVASLPQLFIWQTFQPYPKPHDEWTQCSSIWSVKQRLFILLYHQLIPGNLTQQDVDNLARLYQIEKIYSAGHVALVFWIPSALILTCYGLIICKLQKSIDKTFGFSAVTGTAVERSDECSSITGMQFNTSTTRLMGGGPPSPYCEITDCDFRTINNSTSGCSEIVGERTVVEKNRSSLQQIAGSINTEKQKKFSRIASNGLLTAAPVVVAPKTDTIRREHGTTGISGSHHHDSPPLSTDPIMVGKNSPNNNSNNGDNMVGSDVVVQDESLLIAETDAASTGHRRDVSPNLPSKEESSHHHLQQQQQQQLHCSRTGNTSNDSKATNPTNNKHNHRSFAAATLMRAKSKTLRKTVLILFTYIICWSPYNILALWKLVDPSSYQRIFENVIGNKMEFLYNLIVINAILNPLIYGFR